MNEWEFPIISILINEIYKINKLQNNENEKDEIQIVSVSVYVLFQDLLFSFYNS